MTATKYVLKEQHSTCSTLKSFVGSLTAFVPSSKMNTDKKFANKDELEDWLKSRGVDEEKATTAAENLYSEGFDMPSTLLGATADELAEFNISRPIARHLSNKLSQQKQPVAFLVGAIVRGAVQSNGARGNVFKFLERHRGFFSKEEGIQIMYEGEDLTVKAYFKEVGDACDFQTNLNEWEIHKELVNLKGVEIDPITPAEVPKPCDLERIRLQDYDPRESESPCQTLDQLHSYRLSVPVTEPVEPSAPLVRYQSIDKLVPHICHYKCHLKDKAKFKSLQNDENNMVAASWQFHQMMDGLNTTEGIPLVALSVKAASEQRNAAYDNRYAVTLLLEFYYEHLTAVFVAKESARRVNSSSWETVVYVCDKTEFEKCIVWKFNDTQKKWEEHRAFLELE
eukprot:scaffold12169_cov132-Cylindrotheca_fusiformis.AAC.1